MKALTRKHVEIQLVYHHLREARHHTSEYAINFIRCNYFFDEDSLYIYRVLGLDLEAERMQYLNAGITSVMYRQVMNNEYQD